jgi:energy-coupling factor transport system ATP-binding protein
MKSIIEIKQCSFSYEDGETRLRDINLTIQTGEVVVLTGPSGSGKSTLTKVINGLAPYFYEGTLSGEIWLLGLNLADIPSWERGRYVGNVFQDPRSQFFANEVAGEIAFGCENYGFSHNEIVQNVHQSARELDVENILEHKVRFLSYGMRQRVAIASAEAIDPPIYVMDEPSANLDMAATSNFAELIKKLKSQGKTIFIAEHRLYYLRDIADRIIYLRDGEIVASFSPEEVANLEQDQINQWGLRSMALNTLPVQRSIRIPETETVLEVKGLCKTFGNHTVAKDIGFTCEKGEIIAVVGPNAAGKSTLGKILAGLLKEDAGVVCYAGKQLKPSHRRGLIWYIMQDLDSQLFGEDLTDEMLTGRKPTPERVAKADELLKILNLDSLKKRHPATLSGGQKQRLALGVALMHESPIIILDEPTSGLDGTNMRNVSAQIKKLAQKGHIILMITHDVECALSTCNRALHIQNGRLMNDFTIQSAEQLLEIMNGRGHLNHATKGAEA